MDTMNKTASLHKKKCKKEKRTNYGIRCLILYKWNFKNGVQKCPTTKNWI
jgi:hypothetical protein